MNRKDRRENNYKEYPQQALQNLLILKRLKRFGFTLHESMEFLDLVASDAASCENVSEKAKEKVLEIDNRIAQLQELKSLLVTAVEKCLADNAAAEQKGACQLVSPIIQPNPLNH